jgi:ribonuclease-3
MLGDTFEALIGAVYVDKDYNFTRKFITDRIIKPHIDIHTLELTETNFKSKLLEWCQRHGKTLRFDLIPNGEGESLRLFTIQIVVDGENYAIGRDYNKKNAEKIAAEKTCGLLDI